MTPDTPDILPNEAGYTRKKSRFKGMDPKGDKLRYGKKKVEIPEKSSHISSAAISRQMHEAISKQDKDDNIGIEAVNRSTELAEDSAYVVRDTVNRVKYGHKLHSSKKEAQTAKKAADTAESSIGAVDEVPTAPKSQRSFKAQQEQTNTSWFSRWKQKQAIKAEYNAARTGKETGSAASSAVQGTKKISEKVKDALGSVAQTIAEHPGAVITCGCLALILIFVTTTFSSCSVMSGNPGATILGTSYTATDEDIIGANDDYKALEAALQSRISRIESTYPGYDEYQYDLAEINHNPYVLTSYLTVLFEDYTREEVQATLHEIFDAQYELTTREEIQIRTRTETRTGTTTVTDPETGEETEEEYEYEVEVEYEYRILHVKLTNNSMELVVMNSHLSDDQMERYLLLNQTLGNRSYLFEGDIYANSSPGLEYTLNTEALSDVKFANMMHEATKYLGYPYVWGGSSPSTSFDCSGFVCWVINHCGNGWNVGRTTAEGLRQMLRIIPASEAKPGDIIFFQGTYNTTGASHVGIYVGDGMMIHCGNPIQYASVNSAYFQAHFYCYGRLPSD
ncbi:MAG: C40 family peptidase [Solobacterium sp.]|nr:C40 family peptidase [Solobacterium sp.]